MSRIDNKKKPSKTLKEKRHDKQEKKLHKDEEKA